MKPEPNQKFSAILESAIDNLRCRILEAFENSECAFENMSSTKRKNEGPCDELEDRLQDKNVEFAVEYLAKVRKRMSQKPPDTNDADPMGDRSSIKRSGIALDVNDDDSGENYPSECSEGGRANRVSSLNSDSHHDLPTDESDEPEPKAKKVHPTRSRPHFGETTETKGQKKHSGILVSHVGSSKEQGKKPSVMIEPQRDSEARRRVSVFSRSSMISGVRLSWRRTSTNTSTSSKQVSRCPDLMGAKPLGVFDLHDFWLRSYTRQSRVTSGGRLGSDTFDSCEYTTRQPSFFMVRPESWFCTLVSAFAAVLVLYECTVLPLQMAQLVETTPNMAVAELCLLVFWVFDLAMNFRTGFYVDGVPEMRVSKVAEHYVRKWFIWDLVVVVADGAWLLAREIGGPGAQDRLGFKILRLVKLLRLLRMRRIVALTRRLLDLISSEYVLTIATLTRLVVSVLFLNHYIACAWYAVIFLSSDEKKDTWLPDANELSRAHRYVCAFHWSITQFTPATQNLGPNTFVERAFAIFVVLIALLTFSTFLGKMTTAMSQLLSINSHVHQEEFVLRKFFCDNHISEELKTNIWRSWRLQLQRRPNQLLISQVSGINLLPTRLKMRIKSELYQPALKHMPIFRNSMFLSAHEMPHICASITERVSNTLDEIFTPNTEATVTMCPLSGKFSYETRFLREQVRIDAPEWIAEAVLWGNWYHCGVLTAASPTKWLELSVIHFQNALEASMCKTFGRVVQRYATAFMVYASTHLILDVVIDEYDNNERVSIIKKAMQHEMKGGRTNIDESS